MINSNELPHTRETSLRAEARGASEHTPLPQDAVRALLERRLRMLDSLQYEISATLYDVLRAKVAYEEASLLAIIESGERDREAKKRSDKVLKAEYFAQKPLPSHIF